MARALILISLTVFLALPRVSLGYCLDKYPGQTSYAVWKAQPIKYRVSSNLTDTKILAAIDAAFQAWAADGCTALTFKKEAAFAIASVQFNSASDYINIHWVTKTAELPSGMDAKWFAFHFRSFNPNGQLVGGAVALNALTYKWSSTGGDSATFDVQNVMTHYVGQLIGLTDSKVKNTVMFPDVGFGQTAKRTLTADDLAGIQQMYLAAGCTKPAAPGADGCNNTIVVPPPPPPGDSGTTPTGDGGSTQPKPDTGAVQPGSEAGIPAQPDMGTGPTYYYDQGTPSGGQCTSSSQCAADEVCTQEGVCVKTGGGDGDSGCNTGSAPAGVPLWPGLLLCLGLLLLRRRS